MYAIFADVNVGRKNLAFGIALFLVLGVVVGIPLTIDFLGGSTFTAEQYQTWKVIHGYGVFLGFINYFFGVSLDRLNLSRQQKEISSWSILAAGLFGGVARTILVLFSALSEFGIWASLGETVFITIGTYFFVLGQVRGRAQGRRSYQ
jgi:hypothetical protein